MRFFLSLGFLILNLNAYASYHMQAGYIVKGKKGRFSKIIIPDKTQKLTLDGGNLQLHYKVSGKRPKGLSEQYQWKANSLYVKFDLYELKNQQFKKIASPSLMTVLGKAASMQSNDKNGKQIIKFALRLKGPVKQND